MAVERSSFSDDGSFGSRLMKLPKLMATTIKLPSPTRTQRTLSAESIASKPSSFTFNYDSDPFASRQSSTPSTPTTPTTPLILKLSTPPSSPNNPTKAKPLVSLFQRPTSPTAPRILPGSPRLLSSSLLSPKYISAPRETPRPVSTISSSNSINSFQSLEDNRSMIDSLEEKTCPVCLEALSLRLLGEKPHVVPACGHQLHSDCFVAVYGDITPKSRATTSLGLCGVCRRDMKLSEDGPAQGRNKFATMAGLPDAVGSRPIRSTGRASAFGSYDDVTVTPRDASMDDEIVSSHSRSTSTTPYGSTSAYRSPRATTLPNRSSPNISKNQTDAEVGIVRPVIRVKSEYSTVSRSRTDGIKKNLTCMVTISMPSRYPVCVTPLPATTTVNERDEGYGSPRATMSTFSTNSTFLSGTPRNSAPSVAQFTDPAYYAKTPPSAERSDYGTPSSSTNPFRSVVEDLKQRMSDWKGHSLEEFGPLRLYDYINVRKEKNNREFLVYLFEEAILCVADDKRKGFGKLVDGIAGTSDKLRLKGRIYVRHIRTIVDSSQGKDLSLTIFMRDDALDEFVMAFKSRSSLEVWKSQIEGLVALRFQPIISSPPPAPSSGMSIRSGRSDRSEISSSSGAPHSMYSNYSKTTFNSLLPSSGVIHEEQQFDFRQFNQNQFSSSSLIPSPSFIPPTTLREFLPLDLTLILSIGSESTLKLGIIKSALDFIVQTTGPSTRISIITYITGEGNRGMLRKTPFIAVGRSDSRQRFDSIIENLGKETGAGSPEGMVQHKEDSVNLVTAVNLALDIVLQRQTKSALSGILLMNDGKDGAQKQQMDLVMTRAEAANIPMHTIGWGTSHDPSSLWLLSNHTGGTYTFVKDYYNLRDAVAGIVGGMLSVAATNVRVHISVPERRWFRIRKVAGTSGAIVSSDGKDVDIDVGELRYGETKDIMVEVEMEMEPPAKIKQCSPGFSSATDEYFLTIGLDPLALGDNPEFYEKEYERMATDVPLFEVNAAYRDPAAGRNISRLSPSPCLLTINVIPASTGSSQPHPQASDPAILRRRMQLLTADMLTRTLLLMSQSNDVHASRLLVETKRIISTVAGTLISRSSSAYSLTAEQKLAHATLISCAADVGHVLEGVTNHRTEFNASYRNFAAQQSTVLREQRSWSAKSDTERLMWRADNSLYLVKRSVDFVSSR